MKFAFSLSLLALLATAVAAELTIASYNIKHGRNMKGQVKLEDSGKLLATFQPDIVALQEVDNKCGRSGKVDQAAALGKQLGMRHAFGKFMDYGGGQYGMALLSKFPILETNSHLLPQGAEPRIALEIVVEPSQGKKVSFVCIHFDYTSEARRQTQIKELIKQLADVTHPVVLIGDFNAKPDSESIALFKNDWYNVPKEGSSLTFPSDKPRVEIDYFMLRGFDSKPSCKVIEEKVVSDHRPLVLKVNLPK